MEVPIHSIEPGALLDELERIARTKPARVRLDLAPLVDIDAAGVATLRVAVRRLAAAGVAVELGGATGKVARLLADTPTVGPPEPSPAPGLFERLGAATVRFWLGSVALAELSFETLLGSAAALLGRASFSARDVAAQLERIGVDATLIVSLLSFLLGLVLAFQTWVQLEPFGTEQLVLEFVGIGMTRGFAPFIVAVLVAGRTGSAIAAEIATMETRQENDALRVMGISPVRHLVVPRMLALTLAVPAVNVIATAAGTFGAFVVVFTLSADWVSALDRLLVNLAGEDFWLGAVKAVLFGWVIGLAGAYTGLRSGFGAVSVGIAATRGVVASIFFIMIVDAIVTTLWTIAQ